MSTSLSSATSSRSTTPVDTDSRADIRKTIKPPRNSGRLVRPSPSAPPPAEPKPSTGTHTTLGPPIDINFKVPLIPSRTASQRIRRPLTMSEHSNIPEDSDALPVDRAPLASPVPIPIGGSTPTSTSTPNRLKRLSLVARPAALQDSPIISPGNSHGDTPSTAPRTASGTPRALRMRSSISYSPAPTTAPARGMSTPRSPNVYAPHAGMHRGSSDMERSISAASNGIGQGLRSSLDGPHPKGETWSERHADLLQSIAQKQRRINELKLELQAEQSALYSLKARWTSLVSSTFSSPPPLTGQTSTLPIHRSASSTSTTDSSRPASEVDAGGVDLSQRQQRREKEKERGDPPGFQSLLDEVLGTAPLVDPSVVEGGKRFIGTLMRTVGAAAGGTVPAEGNAEDPQGRQGDKQPATTTTSNGAGGGLDLSSIRGMFSWSSAAPKPNTVRIRPAEAESRGTGKTPSPVHSTELTGRSEICRR